MSTVDKRLLYDTSATDVRPALSAVFGELVKLATPVLGSYHSDLYHDALWLDQHATGPVFVFYWSVDRSGTTIGTQPTGLREHAYRMTIENDGGKITLSVI